VVVFRLAVALTEEPCSIYDMTSEKIDQFGGKSTYDVQQKDASPDTGSPADTASAHEMGLGDTSQDTADMKRLGKKQEFKVLDYPP
jgi:hypothetical protein